MAIHLISAGMRQHPLDYGQSIAFDLFGVKENKNPHAVDMGIYLYQD